MSEFELKKPLTCRGYAGQQHVMQTEKSNVLKRLHLAEYKLYVGWWGED